jgi:hypothetical protein
VDEEQSPQPIVPREQFAGVWANRVDVFRSPHEFTIDFLRSDPIEPARGRPVLVARVALSPLLASELIESLQRLWKEYAAGKLPKEMFDGDEA